MNNANAEPKTPEHDKLLQIKEKSQACGEFLDWLTNERGYVLAKYHEHDEDCPRRCDDEHLRPAHPRIVDLLAEFFHIDMGKIEQEKQQMLNALRASKEVR